MKYDGQSSRTLSVTDSRTHIGWIDAKRTIIPATLIKNDLNAIQKQLDQSPLINCPKPARDQLQHIKSLEHAAHSPHIAPGPESFAIALACALINDPPYLLIDQPELGLSRDHIKELAQWIEQESNHRLIFIASRRRWAKSIATQTINLKNPTDDPITPIP